MDSEWGELMTLDKYRRITGAERDKLAAELSQRYDGGATLRELADLTGRSYSFVRRGGAVAGALLVTAALVPVVTASVTRPTAVIPARGGDR